MDEPKGIIDRIASVFRTASGAPSYSELHQRVLDLEDAAKVSERKTAQLRHRATGKVHDLEEENFRLRDALTWYADLANYRPYGLMKLLRAAEDRGHRARKALGRL